MENLLQYSMQVAMLEQLLSQKLITKEEYALIKQKLMRDYKVISNLIT